MSTETPDAERAWQEWQTERGYKHTSAPELFVAGYAARLDALHAEVVELRDVYESQMRVIDNARAERDMYREKAHNFIRLAGSNDRALGRAYDELFSLVNALEKLVEKAMPLNPRVIPVDSISRLAEGHYRADGPNGETTGCYCGIGKDHDEPVPGAEDE